MPKNAAHSLTNSVNLGGKIMMISVRTVLNIRDWILNKRVRQRRDFSLNANFYASGKPTEISNKAS